MERHHATRYRILCLLAMMVPVYSGAGMFDELLMPGPVIQAHSDFEKRCDACHAKLERGQQNKLCVSCHDHSNIAEDIAARVGFHGKNPAVDGERCSHCHSDHKGRDARIVLFNPDAFRHEYADYKLIGEHKAADCGGCHLAGERYSEAPSSCIDCHKTNDPHVGRLGDKCQDCHKEAGWQDNEFDHDRDTQFKLDGKHAEIGCQLCHAGERYKKTPKECVECHLINDRHRGQYGQECQKCHSKSKWDETKFDHGRDTNFQLTGRHQGTPCNACHKGHLFDDKLNVACYSCHRLDDEHKGTNGKRCQECHDSRKWSQVRFEHDKDTKFRLVGSHKGLACESCHKVPTNVANPKSDCIECHRDDDVHQAQQGERCDKCHNESGWGQRVFFDHDLTRFPLIGQHSALTCEECHLTPAYQDTDQDCFACHEKDDVHKQIFKKQCNNCHSPNGWDFWFFDHNHQTDYRLEGRHEGLSCHACHSAPLLPGEKMDQTCFTCHDRDDRHDGEFGRQCERCHSSSSFSDVTYSR